MPHHSHASRRITECTPTTPTDHTHRHRAADCPGRPDSGGTFDERPGKRPGVDHDLFVLMSTELPGRGLLRRLLRHPCRRWDRLHAHQSRRSVRHLHRHERPERLRRDRGHRPRRVLPAHLRRPVRDQQRTGKLLRRRQPLSVGSEYQMDLTTDNDIRCDIFISPAGDDNPDAPFANGTVTIYPTACPVGYAGDRLFRRLLRRPGRRRTFTASPRSGELQPGARSARLWRNQRQRLRRPSLRRSSPGTSPTTSPAISSIASSSTARSGRPATRDRHERLRDPGRRSGRRRHPLRLVHRPHRLPGRRRWIDHDLQHRLPTGLQRVRATTPIAMTTRSPASRSPHRRSSSTSRPAA